MAKRLVGKISSKSPVRKEGGSTKSINPKAHRAEDIKKSSLSSKKLPLGKVHRKELEIEDEKGIDWN